MELKPLFRDIADAIRQKDRTTDPIIASNFPDRIRALPGVPIQAPPKDINFFDYDGTLLFSYTLSEAQTLSALPKPPTHNGLVFQGWNWTLEKIKALTRPMNVGAMYITDDGKTRLKIRVWDKARSNVPLYISQTLSNGVTIDWGDGSKTETLEGIGYISASHQYMSTGDYTISLAVSDGCTLGFGWRSIDKSVIGTASGIGRVYSNLLQNIYIGNGVTTIEAYSFNYCQSLVNISIPDSVAFIEGAVFRSCYSLSSVSLPDGLTTISGYVFQGCYSLSSVSLPDGLTKISHYMFQYCYSLSNVFIPDSVTSIESTSFQNCYSLSNLFVPDNLNQIQGSAFQNCLSLASISIPDGVTEISGNAFSNCLSLSSIVIPGEITSIMELAFYRCYGIAEYHLKPITPPTLADANAFEGIPYDCIIYVPVGSLDAYKTAENWSVYADYMREEPSK